MKSDEKNFKNGILQTKRPTKSHSKVLIKLFQKFVGTGKKPGRAKGAAFRKAKRAEGFGAEPQGLSL